MREVPRAFARPNASCNCICSPMREDWRVQQYDAILMPRRRPAEKPMEARISGCNPRRTAGTPQPMAGIQRSASDRADSTHGRQTTRRNRRRLSKFDTCGANSAKKQSCLRRMLACLDRRGVLSAWDVAGAWQDRRDWRLNCPSSSSLLSPKAMGFSRVANPGRTPN